MTDTAAPVFDLVIPQKATLRRTWRLRLADGTYFDYTGYTARGKVKASLEEGAATLLDLDAYLEVDATRIMLVVPNEITAELDFDAAVWDLVTEDPDGVVERFLQGAAVLDRGLST